MTLEFAPDASLDLEEIAEDNPARARSFRQELLNKCEAAAINPKLHRVRSEIDASIRIINHGDYLIVFRETNDGIRIQRVIHGARDYKSLL